LGTRRHIACNREYEKFKLCNCRSQKYIACSLSNGLIFFSIENNLDQQNPNEDGPNIYMDGEARMFNDKGELVRTFLLYYFLFMLMQTSKNLIFNYRFPIRVFYRTCNKNK
jgi:hypothetical protein